MAATVGEVDGFSSWEETVGKAKQLMKNKPHPHKKQEGPYCKWNLTSYFVDVRSVLRPEEMERSSAKVDQIIF